VLTGMPEVQICTAYRTPAGETRDLPADRSMLAQAVPVWETMPGWEEEITSACAMDDLPAQARDYVNRVSELVGVPVELVSVGPDRKQTIVAERGALARFRCRA